MSSRAIKPKGVRAKKARMRVLQRASSQARLQKKKEREAAEAAINHTCPPCEHCGLPRVSPPEVIEEKRTGAQKRKSQPAAPLGTQKRARAAPTVASVCTLKVDATATEDVAAQLQKDGVVVLSGVFSAAVLQQLKKAHDDEWTQIERALKEGALKRKPNDHQYDWILDEKRYKMVPQYEYKETVVYELAPGRYDFWEGLDPARGIFAEEAFHSPPPLHALMKLLLKRDYSLFAGALPSVKRSGVGYWHRDTVSLWDDEALECSLPPWYYTVIVPLCDVDDTRGPTEFILGSHKALWETCSVKGTRVRAVCQAGDMVIFDGRMCHRGTPNQTDAPRTALYMVFHKNFYDAQTV